jgi:hypothetical protein
LRDLSLSSARFSKPTQSSQREIAFTSAESTIPKLLNLFAARAWSGVTGTTLNATAYPGLVAPLARVAAQNSCSDDAEDYVDGLNTICFNQSSDGFTTGVLAFTRTITANAVGVTVGSSAPAQFVGQILDSDTLFRNDGQAIYATPAAFAKAPTIWNRCSLTNSATGSASIIPAFSAPSCFLLPRRPASSSAIVLLPPPQTARLPTMTAPPRVSSTLIPTIP